MRVGILEDDPTLARELQELLTREGHKSYMHRSAESLIAFLSHETVDVLLLDWNTEGTQGAELIRRIREENSHYPPIVVLNALGADQDIIAAFRAGTDGYVHKPVQPALLLARIDALYERWYRQGPVSRIERHGDYAFDTASETVIRDDSTVRLTSKEFALALLFFRNQNRTLSRTYIFEALWGSSPEMQTRTVDSHISKLRAKLKLRGEHGFRLVPVYGFGYRLDAIDPNDAIKQHEIRANVLT